jgi:AraC family ethanolamine operon transcriptional activator
VPLFARPIRSKQLVSCPPQWTQIARGSFSSSLRSVRVGGARVYHDRVSVGSQYQGVLESGTMLFGVSGSAATRARWFGMPLTQDDVAVARCHIDVCSTGPGELLSIELDADAVTKLDLPVTSDDAYLLRSPSSAARLRSLLRLQFADAQFLRRARGDARGGEDALYALVREAFAGRRILPGALTLRFRAVRACEAYMRAHIDEPISLQNLSDACGFRPRSLINAFEAFTGVSPMAYLKALRLNGVRNALRVAERERVRIIDVAMDWGFDHMGHFAADYRAMFGERPSETSRAQGLAAPASAGSRPLALT